MGVLAMFGAIGMLFVLPWLDTSKVRSMRYRPTARIYFFFWILACLVLGWCGGQEPEGHVIPGLTGPTFIDYDINSVRLARRVGAIYYFAYFLVITPLLGLLETPLPVPDSSSTPVLGHGAAAPAGAVAAPEKEG